MHKGTDLRTFVTHPTAATGKVPTIFFVGWLSCYSMEYPDAQTPDGFGKLLRSLIETSGYATVRLDKPGVGESEGNCAKTDFLQEMDAWQKAFDAMSKYDFIDLDRVFVIGLSNGGGFSPMASRTHHVRGFISCGSWGRTWYEHMLDAERQRLIDKGLAPSDVNKGMKSLADFYLLYLTKGLSPREILALHPEWVPLWNGTDDGQYGRPAAFYQQLQGLNLGEVWQNVEAPVLVVHGTGDTVMSRADGMAIVVSANHRGTERAQFVEIAGMTHGFDVNGHFATQLPPLLLRWMRDTLEGRNSSMNDPNTP